MNARPLLLWLLAAHLGCALAQYKCTAANGAVTLQDTPCVGAKTAQRLDIVPNGHPAGEAAPASGSVDKRMLADYAKQDQRAALVRAVRKAQDEAAARRQQRDAEMAAARKRFQQEPPDSPLLAGALSDIESRYKAFAVIDQDHVQAAQGALQAWDKANSGQAR